MLKQTLQRYYSFDSYSAFEAFELLRVQQVAAGQLTVMAPPAAAAFISHQPDGWYQLPGTQEIWVLSTPDNAWRGYFLPLTVALTYQQKLRRRDQLTKYASLSCVLLLAILIIWLITS